MADNCSCFVSINSVLASSRSRVAEGWRSFAPYDGIIVTAGAADVPRPLLDQLRIVGDGNRPAGRLVIPVGSLEGQTMNRITRLGPNAFEREETHVFRFVPLVGRGGLREQDEGGRAKGGG